MFKGQPKGLFVLALANMGERFGYYTMMAIFALYLQAKFGFSPAKTSFIYSTFIAFVYFLPLLGGLIADKLLGYGKTVLIGILIMFAGYALLAVPSGSDNAGFMMMVGALTLIALGTGLFKGNLQVMNGNLFDDPKYSAKRDVAFSIFYMFINVGAFFAPGAAQAVSNHILAKDNLKYEAKVPELSIKYLNYKVVDSVQFSNNVLLKAKEKKDIIKDYPSYLSSEKKGQAVLFQHEKDKIGAELETIGKSQLGNLFTDTGSFAKKYTVSLSKSYNWGFGIACLSMIISLLIFIIGRSTYKHADFSEKQKAKDENKKSEIVELTHDETKTRIVALLLVFFVVIFFWMSFQQNGLCMTFFARDYTNLNVSSGLYLWFTLKALLPFILGFYGLLMIFQNKDVKRKMIGGGMLLVAMVFIGLVYHNAGSGSFKITPPIFQQFNPFFIVILTPIFVALFSWLNSKGKEPSAPRKIGFGMIIAAIGFVILLFASLGQKSPSDLVSVSDSLVSPNWLISTYFVLTIAELFLSPMGISFVSRVAPPKYKGMMQGGWFAATAIGNYLVGLMGFFWDKLPLWLFWLILITCCILSAAFIFSVMKRLERATQNV
ncbi:MAG: peptide MFS transporter [Bacteroidia bacterium]|nr:peptide MFS transporter [Bacteroidia bacterium]